MSAVRESSIAKVRGRQVWDSRGRPTVEAEITLACGRTGRAIAPAGASKGSGEALDLRDQTSSFGGFGVERALNNINTEITDLLSGMDALDQEAIDQTMIEADGCQDKSRLGGNALIAVSMANLAAAANARGIAIWQALASDREIILPRPEIQIFGGGAHAGRRIDIQDIMAVPMSATTFDEALAQVAEVYAAAGKLMETAGKSCGVADEGGWWPEFDANEEALDVLMRAIEAAGLKPGVDIAISLDIAANELDANGRYRLNLEGKTLASDEMIEWLGKWIDRYPIVAIEDPLAEVDAVGLKNFTETYGGRVQVVGDDYLVTDANRIVAAAEHGICNSALIKPNQAGTVSETEAAFKAAKNAGWTAIVSARSGETEDVTIAHLAVGWGADLLKVGAFSRSERMAKWNEVLRIAESVSGSATLARLGF